MKAAPLLLASHPIAAALARSVNGMVFAVGVAPLVPVDLATEQGRPHNALKSVLPTPGSCLLPAREVHPSTGQSVAFQKAGDRRPERERKRHHLDRHPGPLLLAMQTQPPAQ